MDEFYILCVLCCLCVICLCFFNKSAEQKNINKRFKEALKDKNAWSYKTGGLMKNGVYSVHLGLGEYPTQFYISGSEVTDCISAVTHFRASSLGKKLRKVHRNWQLKEILQDSR